MVLPMNVDLQLHVLINYIDYAECTTVYYVLMYCTLGWSEEGFRPPFGARLPHSANGGLQESLQCVV